MAAAEPPARRQLNNYGFRKCHTDRYEFGVAGFQRGNPELLKSLKRHDAQRSSKKAAASRQAAAGAGAEEGAPGGAALVELGVYGGMQSEVEQLKRDRLLLLKEVMRLRESASHTAEEVRSLSARLAQTENVQQQMLSFLQQHISPTLLNANSHLLAGRKRRHLLMPASPGRDGDLPMMDLSLPVTTAPPPVPSFDAFMMGAAPPVPPAVASASLSLLELPEEPTAFAPPAPTLPSYAASLPAPPLPDVMRLPMSLAPSVTPPSAEGLEWSDLLFDAATAVQASPGRVEPGGLSRLNSEDIHEILKEMQLDPEPGLSLPTSDLTAPLVRKRLVECLSRAG